jgi:hypothetical protein
MNTVANTELRELNANEIDAVAGAAGFTLKLGSFTLAMSQTDHGVSVHWKEEGGKWQGTTVNYDDLPN